LPSGPILVNTFNNSLVRDSIRRQYEVVELRAEETARRIDSKWKKGEGRWFSEGEAKMEIYKFGGRDAETLQYLQQRRSTQQQLTLSLNVPMQSIVTTGLERYVAAVVMGEIYIIPDTPLAKLFVTIRNRAANTPSENLRLAVFMEAVRSSLGSRPVDVAQTLASLDRQVKELEATLPMDIGKSELVAAMEECGSRVRVFHPFSWVQRNAEV
jgi:hypothetical protein